MKLSLVDTHAHLDIDAFEPDRSEVIIRALDAGVSRIINPGINLESSQRAIELAEKHPEILAAVGIHPHQAFGVSEKDIANLAEIAKYPRVVAIGEVGLDFYRGFSPKEAQLQALQWQLELAATLDLPIIIHCRQAETEMLTLLRDWTSRHKELKGQPRGVIHCFSGNSETAQQYLEMGFFLSLGAYIGYPSSYRWRNIIKTLPQDRLVIETDCPALAPQIHRGQRNEPAYLPLTASLLAEIRGVAPETIAQETTQNAYHLFRLALKERAI